MTNKQQLPICFLQFQKAYLVLAILLTLACISQVYAQSTLREPQFNHISVKEGLSQSTVFCITQDRLNFMWFGTRSGGLNRYDGCEFKVFKHDPNDSTSISNNEVISLLEDHEGTLWVGTRKGGLNRFNHTTERFQRYDNVSSNNRKITANALFQDSKHRIWVATNVGIDMIVNDNYNTNHLPALANKHLTAIAEDENGNIYISDKKGLYVYKEKQNELKYYPFSEDKTAKLSSSYSTPIFIDSQQRVWIGTTKGVCIFENDSIKSPFNHLAQGAIIPTAETRSIHEDSQGNLWFGTIQGLFCYNDQKGKMQLHTKNDHNSQSLNHNSIYSLYEDKSGILWIGTWGGGVNMHSYKLFKFEHYKHQNYNTKSLSNNSVSSFAEGENGIWISTESGGLNFLRDHSIEFENISTEASSRPKLNSDHIKALLKSKSDDLYIGSYGGGLSRLNTKTRNITHILPQEKVFSLAEYPQGVIWAGTLNGLFRYNEKTKEVKHYQRIIGDAKSLSHNFINSLFVSSNQTLWLGTKEAGLMKYNAKDDNFTRYTNTNNNAKGLLSNYVITMAEDLNGNLLIGTSNGINIFNPLHQNFERLEIVDLPDKNINGIICDLDNNYWISTNKGITKYSHDGTPVNYDINDGLQSNEFNRNSSFIDSKGNVYFGGINGFNIIRPKQVPINTEIPEIRITKFKLSNQDVSVESKNSPLKQHIIETEHIELKHDQNDLSFEFVALNYIVSQKNQYAYKLIGYNDEWVYCGNNRLANYTNLKPGDYTFVVKGSNNDNIWNKEGKAIHISIEQPFRKKPMAYLIYLFILTALFFGLKWLITMRIEQKNLLQFERLEKKQLEDLNQMKLRFFTNVAHEFRTPLTLIAGPLQELREQESQTEEQSYLLNVVQNNVKRLLLLVDEILDFRKASNYKVELKITEASLIDFVNHILDCFRENAAKKNISLEFEHAIELAPLAYFDQSVMDKVIFNLLSNALKYTPDNGKIKISLEEEGNEAIIKVADSGKGIEKNDLERIFDRFYQGKNIQGNFSGSGIGLAYAKRLIEAHQGSISVESTIDIGTTFTAQLPIDKASYAELLSNEKTSLAVETKQDKKDQEIATITPPDSDDGKSPYHILIVEDNEELNAYLKYYFRAFNVDTAFNGKEGLEKATKLMPDIIISDVMMPEMDGFEMCQKLKDQFLTSHIPVILLTAKSEKDHKIEGIQLGADAYIEKPFDNKLLEATLHNILAQRKKLKLRLTGEEELDSQMEKRSPHDQRFIEQVDKTIKEHMHSADFSVENLAENLGMSRSQLFRKFKALYELSPSETLRIERLNYAKKLIAEREHNVNEISDLAGFNSPSYFITSFKKHFGITPTEYLKK